MVVLKGIEVNVVVEGRLLEEFTSDSAERSNSKAFRYVESVPGAKYSINFTIPYNFCRRQNLAGVEVCLYIDGEAVGGYFCEPEYGDEIAFGAIKCHHDGICFEQDLIFAETAIDEGQAIPQERLGSFRSNAADLGLIVLDVHRVESATPLPQWSSRRLLSDDAMSIPKKALTGLLSTHRTSYGPSKVVEPDLDWDTVYIDQLGQPFTRFVFRHLSRESLQALGLRDPSPEPTERRGKDMSHDELARWFDRHKASIAVAEKIKTEGIKREDLKQEVTSSVAIKRERSPTDATELSITGARRATRPLVAGDTMDLTDEPPDVVEVTREQVTRSRTKRKRSNGDDSATETKTPVKAPQLTDFEELVDLSDEL